jgi:hypothetical protein
MGEPVKIAGLARDLIVLSGLKAGDDVALGVGMIPAKRGATVMTMARDKKLLLRLAALLAKLTPQERARLLARVERLGQRRPLSRDFRPPVLANSGGLWIGGSLRREEMYGDDGR